MGRTMTGSQAPPICSPFILLKSVFFWESIKADARGAIQDVLYLQEKDTFKLKETQEFIE